MAHGVIVGGVPIGEPAFVAEHMRREADEIVSYIQKTVTQLHDSPGSALFLLQCEWSSLATVAN